MTQRAVQILRWIAIFPGIYVSWHLSLIVGMALLAIAEAFCPKDQMVSGLCVAPWFFWIEDAIFLFCAALATALVVASAAFIAPAHRVRVAWVAFIGGCLVAGYLGWSTDAFMELAAAVASGLVTALAIDRREQRARPTIHGV